MASDVEKNSKKISDKFPPRKLWSFPHFSHIFRFQIHFIGTLGKICMLNIYQKFSIHFTGYFRDLYFHSLEAFSRARNRRHVDSISIWEQIGDEEKTTKVKGNSLGQNKLPKAVARYFLQKIIHGLSSKRFSRDSNVNAVHLIRN